jgi:hypothetical protein
MKPNDTIHDRPAMTTGDICQKLGFAVTCEFLTKLGFPPDETTATAYFWYSERFQNICGALIHHLKIITDE